MISYWIKNLRQNPSNYPLFIFVHSTNHIPLKSLPYSYIDSSIVNFTSRANSSILPNQSWKCILCFKHSSLHNQHKKITTLLLFIHHLSSYYQKLTFPSYLSFSNSILFLSILDLIKLKITNLNWSYPIHITHGAKRSCSRVCKSRERERKSMVIKKGVAAIVLSYYFVSFDFLSYCFLYVYFFSDLS